MLRYFLCLFLFVFQTGFSGTLEDTVKKIITETQDIPGLKTEEFNLLRDDILNNWEELVAEGTKEFLGSDQEVRPYMVSIQGVVEHAIASLLGQEISSVTMIIHTPAPPTPLCTEGEISEGLVDPSMENDSTRLITIKSRAFILRNLLAKGGFLYAAYPQGGRKLRTEKMITIYEQALATYAENLKDVELKCTELTSDMVGAIYFITFKDGTDYGFAIQIPQANQPNLTPCSHRLWFGNLTTPTVSSRLERVLSFLNSVSTQTFEIKRQ